ncbi:MAG: hypothetical protein DCC49_06105 [Acidobacteria bacterium]|nr:MAG: hypothetical protein DCC49_06105 [Acidobacteriota bacterium]
MARGRLSLSLSLVVSSDAAALALPRSDLSGLSSGARSVFASLFSGGHSIGETYSDFDDIPAEAPSEEEDLDELGIPTAPVFEGPRGYVEGQSRELVEERTERSKTYVNPDGTRTTNFYGGPMHFETSPAPG